MAKAKKRDEGHPLATLAASNLDRAAMEISGTVSALENVQSTRSEVAREHLTQALRHIAEARKLTVETFNQDF